MLDIMSAAIKCFRSGSIVWAEEGQEFCSSDDSSGQQCALFFIHLFLSEALEQLIIGI